ncbi:MAG TPA: phosphatase PAP2 family protein [Solirubrobacteraceae bacterium]|nr:phosphatase PAP2 family protein [Solirubrobacteraceae bacterium]
MAALSRSAEKSILWLVLAAGLASLGGRRGRRAAENGVLAIAASSATANGLKLLIGRRRPAPRRVLTRRPRTLSFPSGHAASAFAFATAASRELPAAGPLLTGLAASVAYSRVYLGVHYPSDVLAGAALGTAFGATARSGARKLGLGERAASGPPPFPEAVLVSSPHAGHSSGLARAREELGRRGIRVVEELDIGHVDRLPEVLAAMTAEPPMVIAAGGDGTLGSVAGFLAGTENVLGILPLGTGNDFARAFDIPLDGREAAELLATGEVSRVDLGRLTRDGRPPAYFAHAATAGLNVNFSKLATSASVRARLGRLTYLVSAVYALREGGAFQCTLQHEGTAEELSLLQLSVISAPVIGGSLGLSVRSPYSDDHRLDVIAVEDVRPAKMLQAGLFILLGIKRPVSGVRTMHVDQFAVASQRPLALALDGELDGNLPGQFDTWAGALRVITPRRA